jgi:alkanesulfonate monooxygenase SsuD/methylene tetrahydromethanopterin reductase-like flavin-dependent oxidoreductase (luciferase family)
MTVPNMAASSTAGPNNMVVDLQVNPGNAKWLELADAARAAEAAGFDTFWTADHLAGEVMAAPRMPECFTTLGALAAVTSSIRLGPLVANAANRLAVITANAAATLQEISGGRCVLGLGAGSAPNTKWSAERRAVGVEQPPTMAERHRVLLQTLDLIDELWSPNRRDDLRTFIAPSPRPPIVLGVNSTTLARIAAQRTDGVNVHASAAYAQEVISAAVAERAARDASVRDASVRDTSANTARIAVPRSHRPFIVSVWEHFDERLANDPHDERIERWKSWGVNRVILLMFRGVDVSAIARSKPRG